MNQASGQSSNNRESIVQKLHGAIALLRRERDDAHRAKELSFERLRCVKEERETTEKAVRALQSKLNELQNSSSKGGDDDSNLKLIEKVEHLEKEVRFQHRELIGKKEKLERLSSKVQEEAKVRASSIKSAREALRKRRDKNLLLESNDRSMITITKENESVNKNHIQHEISILEDEEILPNIPRIVLQKTKIIDSETEEIRQNNALLRIHITGYKRCLGLISEEDKDQNDLSEDLIL